MRKKLLLRTAASLLTVALLAGCGTSSAAESTAGASGTAVSEAAAAVDADTADSEAAAGESDTTDSETADSVAAGSSASSETASAATGSTSETAAAGSETASSESETASVSSAASAVSAADPDEGYTLIGTKAEGENTYRVLLKNSTGRGITGIQIKEIHKGEYPDSMLAKGDTFADGEERVLYLDGSEDGEGAEYNVRVTFEDGQVKDITSFPFNDLTEAELKYDDDTLYVSYVSVETGEEKDTLEREAALRKTAEDAKKAAEAAAKAKANSSKKSSGSKSSGSKSKSKSKKEVSRERYDDCDGSGHGYYIITYSDGSTKTVNY